MIKVFLSLVTIHGVLSAPANLPIEYGSPSERNFAEGSLPSIRLQPLKPLAELTGAKNVQDGRSLSLKPFPGSSDKNRAFIDSSLIIDKVLIPADDIELPRYEYNQGWLLLPIEQNRADDSLGLVVVNIQPLPVQRLSYSDALVPVADNQFRPILDVRFGTDTSETASGPYPPETESGPYPPETESGPYPPEAESGPYPPEAESGPYPPEAESGPYPPEAESGPYPPEIESGPYPPEAESGPYPPEAESGPYPPEAESGPYPPETESGPYPPEAESRPYPAETESGPYPPASESVLYQYQAQSGPGLDLGEKGSEIAAAEFLPNGITPLDFPVSSVPTVGSFNSGEDVLGSSVQSQFSNPTPSGTRNSLVIPTGTKIKVQDLHGQYSHGFANIDGTTVQESGHLISTDDGWEYVIAKEGSYSYLSPENIPIYVRYVADDKGYRIISQSFAGR